MNKLVCLLFIAVCWGCTHSTETEKYQNKRDKVVNVHDKVKEIVIPEDDVLIGAVARLYLMDDYLIIVDSHSFDKLIHLFDKNKFSYITGIADKGQGPNEITNMGYLATDEVNRKFYVNDHGKQRIFSYDLDSVLANPLYNMPEVKMKMNEKLFPDTYHYFNDTLSIGLIIEPIGVGDFAQFVGKWNMNTGEIRPMKYKHPEIKKKRITFAVSMEHGIYVECYHRQDLITICSLDGDLKHNIYGPNWQSSGNIHYYGNVVFCKDKIVVAYSGGGWLSDEYPPTKFLIFDINGDYIKTLETGYKISDYCYDKKSNRIIMNLNDADIQFAYLELDGLIE